MDTIIKAYNATSLDQLIAMMASIAACLSAIAALFAVKQNTKNREASYKPEIVATKFSFNATTGKVEKDALANNWTNSGSNSDTSKFNEIKIPVKNIGLGSAKQVEVNWSFEIEEYVKLANTLAQQTLTPAYLELTNGFLS